MVTKNFNRQLHMLSFALFRVFNALGKKWATRSAIWLYKLGACLLFLLSVSALAEEPYTVKIAIETNLLANAHNWLGNRPLSRAIDGEIPPAGRSTTELLILLKSLKRSGHNFDFEFKSIPSLSRASKYAEDKRIDVICNGYFDDHEIITNGNFLASTPYIQHGEAIVGLFSSTNNKDALSIKTLDELKNLRHAVVRGWHVDERSLRAYGVKKVYYANSYVSLVRMLEAGHVDVAPLEFTSHLGLNRFYAQVDMAPIPNFKLALDGQRVFLVARKSPKAEIILESLNQGIEQMRASGEIQQMFQVSNYHPKEIKNWTLIPLKKTSPPQ